MDDELAAIELGDRSVRFESRGDGRLRLRVLMRAAGSASGSTWTGTGLVPLYLLLACGNVGSGC
jgi:hypothetical protein